MNHEREDHGADWAEALLDEDAVRVSHAVLAATQGPLARRRWAHRGSRALLLVAVFLGGFASHGFLGTDTLPTTHPGTAPLVVSGPPVSEEDSTQEANQDQEMPRDVTAMDAMDLELTGLALKGSQRISRMLLAGDRYLLRHDDHAAAARCYGFALDEGASRDVGPGDSWLLAMMKTAP